MQERGYLRTISASLLLASSLTITAPSQTTGECIPHTHPFPVSSAVTHLFHINTLNHSNITNSVDPRKGDQTIDMVLRMRGGMYHVSSGFISPTNPLACTCHSSLSAADVKYLCFGDSSQFAHGCGISTAIMAANTFCRSCSTFNCGIPSHNEGGEGNPYCPTCRVFNCGVTGHQ